MNDSCPIHSGQWCSCPMPVEEKVRKLIEAHVRGREMNEQRDREKDEQYQLRLVARIQELEAQLEAERKLNNDLALGNLKAQHAGSLLIRDLRRQLEVLQRARITNIEIDRQAHKIGQLERELASTTYAAQTLAESLKTTQKETEK